MEERLQENNVNKYEKSNKEERNSNIELLRIILMILITIHHYGYYTTDLIHINRVTQL